MIKYILGLIIVLAIVIVAVTIGAKDVYKRQDAASLPESKGST